MFLVSGLTYQLLDTHELENMGGVYRYRPWLAVGFISAMSLAGLPPLSGFFAKFVIIKAGVDAGAWWATGFALSVGLLTLYSMVKIWSSVFWKAVPSDKEQKIREYPLAFSMFLPVLMLATMTIFIGLGGEYLFQIAERSAEQLLDRKWLY